MLVDHKTNSFRFANLLFKNTTLTIILNIQAITNQETGTKRESKKNKAIF